MSMTLLNSGLNTHDGGGQGWDATYDSNFEHIDDKLETLFTSTNKVGEQTVTDNSSSANDPDPATATAPTIAAVSGTGDDGTVNGNFTDLESKINALIADNASLRTQLIAAIDYADGLKVTLNDLLQKLRNNGVIGT